MCSMEFRTPESIDELAHFLGSTNDNTYILGGGTDLVIRLRDRGISQGTLIDMTGIKDLDYIRLEDSLFRIGANVPYARIAEDGGIRKHAACLATMASQVGSAQIRNMARLPGNIANASPAGDSIACLMALGARAGIMNSKGDMRWSPVEDIITGIGKTTLGRDEAIIEIIFPEPGNSCRSGYRKIGLAARNEVIIANVSLTLLADYDKERGVINASSIVIGSAAPKAYHAVEAELLLCGQKPGSRLAEDMAAVLRKHVEASINGIKMFRHKVNDIQGMALDLFYDVFNDVL